ncbi:MAG: penicillin-binding transpeptidase domain-containing protein [Anaerolineaceae bacterium]|nr:penicillin-binding transpeptidase domain-containing protein [Anaerolineaceae bacterium]
MNIRTGLALLFLAGLVACSAWNEAPRTPTPTPSPTPVGRTPEQAERVARLFLQAWQDDDMAGMHRLLSFGGQEATLLPAFSDFYRRNQATMTLQSLETRITGQLPGPGGRMTFGYDVVFHTRQVGSFSESGRTLRLTWDTRLQDWRVVWSPGDLLPALADGGALRLDARLPGRANIYDRAGRTLASRNNRVITVNVIKNEIPHVGNCNLRLAAALNLEITLIEQILAARAADWLSEMGAVDPLVWQETRAGLERDCNARFIERPARQYETGPVTAHSVGYVGWPDEVQVAALTAAGFPQDSIIGRSGVEASRDEALRGIPGGRLYVAEAGGAQTTLAERAPGPSQSVWLTLDAPLQAFIHDSLQRARSRAAETWAPGSDGAAAVVLDLRSGAILALVSDPSYDNNVFAPFPAMGREAALELAAQVQDDPRRPLLNRATLGLYPPGSIFKVVPAIAATDSGLYGLNRKYLSTGTWNRDLPRRDWLAGGHGLLSLPEFLKYSCNSCFFEMAWDLDDADPWTLPDYARRLGFGAPTGLRDLPEAAGALNDPDVLAEQGFNWHPSEAVSMAVGQRGVSVTPLQVAQLYATIANDGARYRPQLVQQVSMFGDTPTYTLQPELLAESDFDPEVIALVQGALCTVVSEPGGTAEHVFRGSPLLAQGVCGKTGTAETPGEDTLPHAWFAAWTPATEPEIAIALLVENAGEGSAVAAALVREILEYWFFGREAA